MERLTTNEPNESTKIKRKLVRSGYRTRPKLPGFTFTFIRGFEDYEALLVEKLKEEMDEFREVSFGFPIDRNAYIDEAADVLEVLDTIDGHNNPNLPVDTIPYRNLINKDLAIRKLDKKEVQLRQSDKRIELGGFSLGVVLESQVE